MYPTSKDEGPRDTGNNMSMVQDTRKTNFVSQQWLRFHIWFFMTPYYKMRQVVHYKMRQFY